MTYIDSIAGVYSGTEIGTVLHTENGDTVASYSYTNAPFILEVGKSELDGTKITIDNFDDPQQTYLLFNGKHHFTMNKVWGVAEGAVYELIFDSSNQTVDYNYNSRDSVAIYDNTMGVYNHYIQETSFSVKGSLVH